jgi:homocysteine S-methyltransferase
VSSTWADLFGTAPVVIDGGLSTQLEAQGQDISGSLWTGRALLADPGAVTRAHAAYVAAGADVVITSSYQLSRRGFVESGLTVTEADAALRASTDVARSAVAGSGARVAASVGPYGAILHDGSEYRGRYGRTRQQLADFHRERLDVLVATAPDLLAVETLPDVDEAEALADVLADHPDLPAWMSFSCIDEAHVCAGQSIEEAVSVATSIPTMAAVGVNCTDPRFVTGLIARIRAMTDLPIVVYPNAGGSWDAATGEWHDAVVAGGVFSADLVDAWRAAGATAIGGCCGTDARAISAIAQRLAEPAG